jgi:hypothetical protein
VAIVIPQLQLLFFLSCFKSAANRECTYFGGGGANWMIPPVMQATGREALKKVANQF